MVNKQIETDLFETIKGPLQSTFHIKFSISQTLHAIFFPPFTNPINSEDNIIN